MATIPIEVILQDAESPVTPTPTPESGGETNITVPDTGTISDVNNSGGIGSSAGIILPAIIAVLAIGAIVAMLVHKYRKYQNGKLSKKEKLATVASSTIVILVATVLVGNLVMPATSAATDDTNTNREGELIVDNKITITVTREADSDEAIVSSVDTKSYATVYKSFGYEVAIAMAGNTANLYLDGDTSSEYYIAPVSDDTLADNTWGYTLDGEEYTAMPLMDNLAVVAKGTTPVSDKEVDINYGVKLSSDMPAGTYTGEIEYILADTGFPASLRTMQGMTTDICSSVPTPNPFKADNTTIEDNVPTIMLKDIRDNKLYRVAKLADGKCWMTQNLDLQKEDLVVASLDNTNTDNPADGFTLPVSQTSGEENWVKWGVGEDEGMNTPHVYDLEYANQEYVGYGNYYNWYSATAGTGIRSLADGAVASGSVCPAGWRLPDGSTNGSATDYSILLYNYGAIAGSTSASGSEGYNVRGLLGAPLFMARVGNYSGGAKDIGDLVRYWSSMKGEYYNAYSVTLDSGYIAPWYGGGIFGGYSIRCIAK